ncbi:hypothetical protein [Nocardioides sp. InS609-2]|uniref:hypothetical protein n=1 Tax=Nocardioides sp. InS609-2 TaxID=2760705 RepID=UPI0020C06B4C|nr:hypothetical protein [Nocardioides sp. InS609-2]
MTDDTRRPGPDWDDEDEVLAALGDSMGHDPDRTPPPDRVAALRAAAERMYDPADDETVVPMRGPVRRLLLTGGIAAGIAGIAGYATRSLVDEESAEPEGPVVEAISFTGPASVTTKAGLINHTWGTELLLDVEGLEAARSFDVVYLTAQGDEVPAGSLLAVDGVLMVCRFNAATLRRDVRQIVVRRAGDALLTAELPTVEA